MDVSALLARISQYVLNPIIILGFTVATVVLFWGLAKFIWSADDDTARNDGKRSIGYGIIGMFVMFSVYGILRLVLATFGIQGEYPSILP